VAGSHGIHAIRNVRRWPRRLLITTNVVVAVAIVAVASAYGYVHYRLNQVQRVLNVPGLAPVGSPSPTSQSRPQPGVSVPPFTMLIIGSDTRNLGSASNAAFGNQQTDPGQRSDSILLLRVVPNLHTIGIFSIPRDTLVPIPGYGTTRINTAFNTGNPNLLVNVLNQDFGIQVNHVAQFDFATFEDIANSIGGVYQWFPAPARDAFSDLSIPKAGCVLLTGATALAFARSREYQYELNGQWHYQLFPESDLGRIQRQQDFVKLAAKKAQKIAPTNPFALNSLIGNLTKDVKLDTGFSNSLILDLIKDFRSANLSNIPSYTYPTVNSTSVSGALDPDKALGRQTITQWLNVGTPPPSTTTSVPTAASPKTTTTKTTNTKTKTTNTKTTNTKTTNTKTATTETTIPVKTTTISPGLISIEVVNGSGKSGQATLATSQLKTAGYNATVAADVPFDNARTVIRWAPDALADAKQLQSELPGTKLVEDPVLTPTPYNLELVTGADFAKVDHIGAPVSGSPATTAAPTTTTTIAPETSAAIVGSAKVEADSSSFYKGQYIPPGRVPGQTPQSCPS
jgi:LCP family protein required for cell wall assembly